MPAPILTRPPVSLLNPPPRFCGTEKVALELTTSKPPLNVLELKATPVKLVKGPEACRIPPLNCSVELGETALEEEKPSSPPLFK